MRPDADTVLFALSLLAAALLVTYLAVVTP